MEGWKEYKLSELLEIKYGKDHKKLKNGKYPLYGSGGIMRYVDKFIYDDESILIPRKGTLTNLFYIDTPFSTVDTMFWSKIYKEKVLPKFLYYQLKICDLSLLDVGAAIPSLTTKVLNDFTVMIAKSLPTQRKIAKILSAYDDLIENNLKRIKLLEEMAQKTYEEWFVRFKFPGYETAVFDEESGLPEGWKKRKLGEVCRLIMGQSPKSKFYNTEKRGFPFHQGVKDYGDRFPTNTMWSTNGNRFAEKATVLFSVRAPVGRLNIALEKIILGRGLASISYKNNWNGFLFYQLKQIFFEDNLMGGGAIFNSVTKSDMQRIELIEGAEHTMQQFNEIIKPIDENVENLHIQNQRLKEARDILLPRLMTGMIDVEKIELEL